MVNGKMRQRSPAFFKLICEANQYGKILKDKQKWRSLHSLFCPKNIGIPVELQAVFTIGTSSVKSFSVVQCQIYFNYIYHY